MGRYTQVLKEEIRKLRALGKTYGEIREELEINIPKSSLSDICRGVQMPREYEEIIKSLNHKSLNNARLIAASSNRFKKLRMQESLRKTNLSIAKKIKDKATAKIALAMLCLGEASKSSSKSSGFYLGNSDKRIIQLFLNLLKCCYEFDQSKVRCTVQCRADQNIPDLERYWQDVTGIPKSNFYNSRVDPRTVGKPTLKSGYKGVLKVSYSDKKIQLDLECLADLVYNTTI